MVDLCCRKEAVLCLRNLENIVSLLDVQKNHSGGGSGSIGVEKFIILTNLRGVQVVTGGPMAGLWPEKS